MLNLIYSLAMIFNKKTFESKDMQKKAGSLQSSPIVF